jgi:hypothetical protein
MVFNLTLIINEKNNDKLIVLSKYIIKDQHFLFVNTSSVSFVIFNQSNHIYMLYVWQENYKWYRWGSTQYNTLYSLSSSLVQAIKLILIKRTRRFFFFLTYAYDYIASICIEMVWSLYSHHPLSICCILMFTKKKKDLEIVMYLFKLNEQLKHINSFIYA